MMAECIHELVRCAQCHEPDLERETLSMRSPLVRGERASGPFAASFDGDCALCPNEIQRGDAICRVADADGPNYAHLRCFDH